MKDVIEVGEYVRTESGHIARLLEKTEYDYLFDGVIAEPFGEQWTWLSVNDGIKKIVKHSKQLIDLIVKYRLKNFKYTNVTKVNVIRDVRSNKESILIDGYNLEQIDILEILTKEQYNINCYKVGGKNE